MVIPSHISIACNISISSLIVVIVILIMHNE